VAVATCLYPSDRVATLTNTCSTHRLGEGVRRWT
jgi:hypothetical protein